MREALYYEKLKEAQVNCRLCPHNCVIKKDKTGICRNRKNIDGVLYSLNYAKVSSINLDPIEKKPLYHFYPGSKILSLGTLGCNLGCLFCQNFLISQASVEEESAMVQNLLPEKAVKLALKYKNSGNIGIAYTYNEPFIWYEYVYETAHLAKKNNLKNVLVTNGFVNKAPLLEVLTFIDAANIDLKSMSEDFYKKICHAKLEPVLNTIKIMKKKCLIELTNLVVTNKNDSEDDIKNLVDWVHNNLGKDTPLHFSAYRPCYKMNEKATNEKKLEFAYNYASKKLNYVYVGNVNNPNWLDTFCPNCGTKVVKRGYMNLEEISVKDGNKCGKCGQEMNICTQ